MLTTLKTADVPRVFFWLPAATIPVTRFMLPYNHRTSGRTPFGSDAGPMRAIGMVFETGPMSILTAAMMRRIELSLQTPGRCMTGRIIFPPKNRIFRLRQIFTSLPNAAWLSSTYRWTLSTAPLTNTEFAEPVRIYNPTPCSSCSCPQAAWQKVRRTYGDVEFRLRYFEPPNVRGVFNKRRPARFGSSGSRIYSG